MKYMNQKKNSVYMLLSILLVLMLFVGCDNKSEEVVEKLSSETTEHVNDVQQLDETSSIENNEGGTLQANNDYTIDIDVKDYTIGMTFSIVKCQKNEITEESLAQYLSIVFQSTSDYLKLEENDMLAYISVDRDGRIVEVMDNKSIRFKPLYIDDQNEIVNFFGSSLEHARNIITQLGYSEQVSLLELNNIPTNYDNYKVQLEEPIYEVEYVFAPHANGLYFSSHLGSNNILILCNNECVIKVIDNINFDINNIGEVTINFGYKEAIEVIGNYGLSKDDIIYSVFVYSNVFSDDSSEYTPVWEFGFLDTKIQVDAESGKLHDFLPDR